MQMVFLCLFGCQIEDINPEVPKALQHENQRLEGSWEIPDGVFCEGNFGKNNALYI